MKQIKNYEDWLNEGHSYDKELENARMMRGSADELTQWAMRKIAESRPENYKPVIEVKKEDIDPISYKVQKVGSDPIKATDAVETQDGFTNVKDAQDWKSKQDEPNEWEIAEVTEELTLPLNEAPSKSAIKKQIKIIDKMIDDETGGDGEPLTDETLQDLERERERLEKFLK